MVDIDTYSKNTANIFHEIEKTSFGTRQENSPQAGNTCHYCSKSIKGTPYFMHSALGEEIPFCNSYCYDMWEGWDD